MQITAQLNNLRITPRKVRLVARAIKGMDAVSAKYHLSYIIKKTSNPISKLLDSAMSNAHNNFGLAKDNLFIKDITVNEGVKLKRFRPKGFGMASPIEKKTSHIKIILEEKVPGLKAEPKQKKHEIGHDTSENEQAIKQERLIKSPEKRAEVKKELGKKGVFGQKIKRFFRRKTI